MSSIKGMIIALNTVLLLAIASPAIADSLLDPLGLFSGGEKVEADPNKSYNLTQANGPGMIIAATFSGDQGAAQQAHRLVIELRKNYKMHAYLYHKKFDRKGEDLGHGINEYGEQVRFVEYKNRDKATNAQSDEYAVLIGDFPSVDDPELQKVLKKAQSLKPKSLEPSADQPSYQTLAQWRILFRTKVQPREAGPMSTAFATKNPMMPNLNMKGVVDKFVVELNESSKIQYSLLDVKMPYTVQVATYVGKSMMQKEDIHDIESGRTDWESSLDKAATHAHLVCMELRKKGYEAYEFHDRHSSIVTVGSFTQIGRRMSSGVIDLDPKIVEIMDMFKGIPSKNPATYGRMQQKTLGGVPLDIQPKIVQVPRTSVAAAYAPQRTARAPSSGSYYNR